jgi:hypothetical protein
VSTCGQKLCTAIDKTDEDHKTPEPIHSPVDIC